MWRFTINRKYVRKRNVVFAFLLCGFILTAAPTDAVVVISIGQSNGDGSAFADSLLDAEMEKWYGDSLADHHLKIWFRGCKVQNQESNILGERARWCVDADVPVDNPQWMDLWYKNDNKNHRTAMQMIHGYGTYSAEASDRRGLEGMFGRKFAEAFPDKELYVLKLGVSGSQISTWAHEGDMANWRYFYDKIYKPAIEDLLANGKRPVLAGVFWMQGCADSSSDYLYYRDMLERLVNNLRDTTGFANAKIYVGHILGPGENEICPEGSVAYSKNVRKAQDDVAAYDENVVILPTDDCGMQYEKAFNGYIHFSHDGMNRIGAKLADLMAADKDNWTIFSTPGKWEENDSERIFIPALGNPVITYSADGNSVTARLDYNGWSEIKR